MAATHEPPARPSAVPVTPPPTGRPAPYCGGCGEYHSGDRHGRRTREIDLRVNVDTSGADREIMALGLMVAALEPLDHETRRRVLRYLAARYPEREPARLCGLPFGPAGRHQCDRLAGHAGAHANTAVPYAGAQD